MTVRTRTPYGFGATMQPGDRGAPVTVQTPKVYDFNAEQPPVIPERERSYVRHDDRPTAGGALPRPPVLDFNRR